MQRHLALFLLLSIGPTSLVAQSTLQRRPSSTVPAYVLGPGDQIGVHVEDMDDVPTGPIRIDPSGYIDLPLAGRVQATGLTLDELRIELAKRLSKYITNPEISLNLVDSASQPVSVLGEVNNPGVHQLAGTKRLLEVISASGGVKSDAGSTVIVTRDPRWGKLQLPNATMEPNGYSSVSLSLDALMSGKDPEDNLVMRPDDVVSIPKADLIYVLGDVKKAGGFPLSTHPTVGLLEALSMAEGLSPDNAAKHARILRQVPGGDGIPHEIPVDIEKIEQGKAPDVQLAANDVLFIPHSGAKVVSRRALEAAIGVSTGILIYR